MDELISLKLERTCLGSLFKYPDYIWPEICSFVSEDCFQDQDNLHKIIFCTLRKYLDKGEKFDNVIIANDIKNLGIKLGELDIFEYCEIISSSQINKDGALKGFKELLKLKILRDLIKQSEEVKNYILSNKDKDLSKILGEVDRINNEKINQIYLEENQPKDLFDGIEEQIIVRGNNPVDEIGLRLPFPEFSRLFGSLRASEVYAFTSRPKHGKSSLLNYIALHTCLLEKDCHSLILDTEMTTLDMQFRIASSITGISPWWLETGNYRKNKFLYERFESKRKELSKCKNLVSHINVAGMTISEAERIAKRWFIKYIGHGGKGIIVYDYLKLTGEWQYNKQEYQLLGDKINSLKELSLQLNCPILTACQLNRSAEEGNDTTAAISQTDRLSWFAAFVAIFRRKTYQEMSEDGPEWGTHKMIPLVKRYEGRDASGHHDMIRIKIGKDKFKYVQNFINYRVENFSVEELGSLQTMLASRSDKIDVSEGSEESNLI